MCVEQIQLSIWQLKALTQKFLEEDDANIGLIDLITAEKRCGASLPPLDRYHHPLQSQALVPISALQPLALTWPEATSFPPMQAKAVWAPDAISKRDQAENHHRVPHFQWLWKILQVNI